MFSGAFRARLEESRAEMRDNLGRSILQRLGVMEGVAAVLGGYSISDSQQRRVDEMMVKRGGMDKLVVQPAAAVKDGSSASALQMANLCLRNQDAVEGGELDEAEVAAVSEQRNAHVRVRSPY